MAITPFVLPLTCALLLPLAAAAQTATPATQTATPANACCGAMHQVPATVAAPVDHSTHQVPGAAKPAVPAMKATAAGCCGAEADQPMAKMDCCAGMEAQDGKDAKPCAHCAPKPADKSTETPSAGCCDDHAATGCCH